ncbi:MAG: hypothetical protein M1835_004820 [Candelina submexicana]|nr:MAG: hypothetical protein M1835_004820 [Candelina submexicana]
MVQPYCDGIDLNCGCPQSWACHDGLGAALMHERQKVAEMVRAVKKVCGEEFCVSVKIRVHKDLRETTDFVKTVEAAGVDYITCHGRRRSQRSSEPVDLDAIKLVKETATVPVVANGDVFDHKDVQRIVNFTGVDGESLSPSPLGSSTNTCTGVMSARGLLSNPALFAGYNTTPREAVEKFMGYAVKHPLPLPLVKHHLSEMTVKMLSKKERLEMLDATNMLDLIEWLDERFELPRG